MNAAQMRWAARHDWYLYASLKAGSYTISVMEDSLDNVLEFNDFDALYTWAGY